MRTGGSLWTTPRRWSRRPQSPGAGTVPSVLWEGEACAGAVAVRVAE